MSTESYYISPREFMKLEADSLKKASNCSEFQKISNSKLVNDFSACRNGLEYDNAFNCITHFQVNYADTELIVVLGVNIVVDSGSGLFSENSYKFLIICPSRKEVIRCIQFDFEHFVKRNKEPKPSLHLQMDKGLSPVLNYCQKELEIEIDKEELKGKEYDKPRIPIYPICTVLLLDLLFLEFQTDNRYENVVLSKTWKNAIKMAEDVLLLKYYNFCSDHLASTNPNKKLLSHLLYDHT